MVILNNVPDGPSYKAVSCISTYLCPLNRYGNRLGFFLGGWMDGWSFEVPVGVLLKKGFNALTATSVVVANSRTIYISLQCHYPPRPVCILGAEGRTEKSGCSTSLSCTFSTLSCSKWRKCPWSAFIVIIMYFHHLKSAKDTIGFLLNAFTTALHHF